MSTGRWIEVKSGQRPPEGSYPVVECADGVHRLAIYTRAPWRDNGGRFAIEGWWCESSQRGLEGEEAPVAYFLLPEREREGAAA